MSRLRYMALLLGLALPAGPLLAAAAHVHGHATLDVAVDGAEVTIELDTPADNLLGFERAPRSAADKQQAGKVLAQLGQSAQLFRLNPEAQCSATTPVIEAPLLIGRPVSGEHNDIAASYTYRCAKPAALAQLDVLLFEVFPRLQQIKLQLAGPAGQRGMVLKKGQRSVKLP